VNQLLETEVLPGATQTETMDEQNETALQRKS
jgi:hypothetical protein